MKNIIKAFYCFFLVNISFFSSAGDEFRMGNIPYLTGKGFDMGNGTLPRTQIFGYLSQGVQGVPSVFQSKEISDVKYSVGVSVSIYFSKENSDNYYRIERCYNHYVIVTGDVLIKNTEVFLTDPKIEVIKKDNMWEQCL
ncbi:hypothetical protein L9G15_01355 [Shewanella sp. A3A]|nr:hypothetical protein [Shewanella ferrihydritica]